MPKTPTLAERADRLSRLLEGMQKANDLNAISDALSHRLADIRIAADRAVALAKSKSAMATLSRAKYTKRSLSARVRSLTALRSAFEKNPASLCQPNAFDRAGFETTLRELSDALLKQWRQHAVPDSRMHTLAAALEDDPAESATNRTLQQKAKALYELGQTLPTTKQDLGQIASLQASIVKICDEVEKKGYDQNVGRFLREIRSPNGISLAKLLGDEGVLEWVRQGDRASSIRVVRERRGFLEER